MTQVLISKAEFADRVGVGRSTVSEACKGTLGAAVVDGRIDANHEVAIAYLKKHKAKQALKENPDLDPLFEEVLAKGQEEGAQFSARWIKNNFPVGYNRAVKIREQIAEHGVLPEGAEPMLRPMKMEKKPRGPNKPKVYPERTPEQVEEDAQIIRDEVLGQMAAQAGAGIGPQIDIPDNMQVFADMTLREILRKFGTHTAFADWLKSVKEMEIIEEKRVKVDAARGKLVDRLIVKKGVVDVTDEMCTKILTDGSKTIGARAHMMATGGSDPLEIEEFVRTTLTKFLKPAVDKMVRSLANA